MKLNLYWFINSFALIILPFSKFPILSTSRDRFYNMGGVTYDQELDYYILNITLQTATFTEFVSYYRLPSLLILYFFIYPIFSLTSERNMELKRRISVVNFGVMVWVLSIFFGPILKYQNYLKNGYKDDVVNVSYWIGRTPESSIAEIAFNISGFYISVFLVIISFSMLVNLQTEKLFTEEGVLYPKDTEVIVN